MPPLTHRGDQPQQNDAPCPPQDETTNPNEDYEDIIESLRRGPVAGQQHMRKKDKAGGRAHVADANTQPAPDPPQPSGITMGELLNGK